MVSTVSVVKQSPCRVCRLTIFIRWRIVEVLKLRLTRRWLNRWIYEHLLHDTSEVGKLSFHLLNTYSMHFFWPVELLLTRNQNE